jgi:hypothetical protein
MAQTKRKRRTKHRGNAAGKVESRGRTSRANATSGKPSGRMLRADRLNQPPSWRSAINRAGIATVLFIVVVTLIGQSLGTAIAIGGFMFIMYVPLGYYTDSWIYRRRQSKRTGKG